jgi:hypothetical protein
MAHDVADKIIKLLLKAESTEHEGERDLLIAKAQQLQLAYQIDQSELARRRDQALPEKLVEITIEMGRRGAGLQGRRSLAARICETLPVQGIADIQKGHFVIFGYESDVQLARLLYHALLVHAEAELVRASRRRPRWTKPTTFRANFMTAYAGKVGQRLADQQQNAMERMQDVIDERTAAQERAQIDRTSSETIPQSSSVELIVQERKDQVMAVASDRYETYQRPMSAMTYCGAARSAGRRAAARADLNPGRGKLKKRELIER